MAEKSGCAGLLAGREDCQSEERQKTEGRGQNEEPTPPFRHPSTGGDRRTDMMKAGEIMRNYGVSRWYLKKMRESGILKPRVVMGGVYSVYNREEVQEVLGSKI